MSAGEGDIQGGCYPPCTLLRVLGLKPVSYTHLDVYKRQSQNEQDSRNYARAAKVPMVEPADSKECRDFTKLAYELSEEFDTPVILRLTTRIAHSRSIVEDGERKELPLKEYKKDPSKNVMLPPLPAPSTRRWRPVPAPSPPTPRPPP